MRSPKSAPSKNISAAQAAQILSATVPEIMNLFFRLTQGMSCPEDLSVPQFKVLQNLGFAGRPLRMSELSRLLGVSQSTLTDTVKKLVEMQLLQRERSSTDDRVVFLHLTPKSQALAPAPRRNPAASLRKHMPQHHS